MAKAAHGQRRTIRGDRWLTVAALRGYVEIQPMGETRRRARLGDRLDRVGDILTTGPQASARLEVDLAIGFVSVAENSQLQIRTLSITQNGARITELFVLRGQVRLRVRPLTNPNTRLEIHTPAGVSGVRGTDFGVTVALDGQTGVATLEGRVVASAQGQTVSVAADQQSLIRQGEAPTPPAPLRNDPTLYIEVLRVTDTTDEQNRPLVQVAGYTDVVNLLRLAGEQVTLNRNGRFDMFLPIMANRRVEALVTTPLGTTQTYELVVP
ncbi:MAG: FecR family protein [Cyanobacteria bacterium J06581_3]